MKAHAFVGASIFSFLFSTVLSSSAMAQGVGAIGGTVTDESGAVLPGATVSLSNPGAIGGNQATATNDRGTYQFTRLIPGRYSVKVELQGFRSAIQENIVVNADVTARADVKLEIGALEEGITVRAEAPLLDTTSALKQAVISADVLTKLPNRVDVWGIVKMVPAVSLSKVDVGGNESFLQSNATLHGTANENGYMIDGMDITYALSAVTILYPDPYVFQEVNFQLGGGSAELSQGGVVFNQITKSGTNVLHGGYMFAGASHGMGTNNATSALRAQLLAAVPARALAANPNIVPGADIQRIYDSGGWLGGPIKRDKLWFLGAGHSQVLNQYVLGSYNTDGTQVADDNVMWNAAAKLSWQMTRSSQLSYFYNLQYKLIRYRNNDVSFFTETRARDLNDKYPNVHQVKWTKTFGSRIALDVSGSRFYNNCDCFLPQPEVNDGDLARFDSVLNTVTGARPTYMKLEQMRSVLLTSASYYASDHQIKAGYSFNMSYLRTQNFSINNSLRAVYRNGVPDSVNTYNTPVDYEVDTRDQAVYIQDRWTPFKKLTLNLGLRFEALYASEQAPCQPETQWIRGQCFPAIEGVPDFKGPVPRFSAIYDLFGTGRTALKASANRYHIWVGGSLITQVNPIRLTNDTRSWADANGDLVPQLSELGPSTGFNLGTTSRFSADLVSPTSNEYAVELQHQLPGNMVATATYTYRQTQNNIGARNVAVPRDTYIPLQVTEVTSGKPVTVFNQAPALRGRFDTLFDNEPELDTTYKGVDLSLQKRLGNGWMLSGGASFGKNVGDIHCGGLTCTADLNNPNFLFRRGISGLDSPYAYRASGLYQFPYGISVSATAQHNAGFPELTTVLVSGNTIALTQVSQSLVVDPRATTRFPALNTLDVSVTRTWRVGTLSMAPRIDFYNLGNVATILGRIQQLGPTYGRVNSIQRGRLIKLGVNVDF